MRANRWIHENRKEAVEIAAKEIGIPVEHADRAYDYYITNKIQPLDGTVPEQGVQKVIESLGELGELQKPYPPTSRFIDMSYLREEKHGLKASFNVNGLAAVRYPEAVKEIHRAGHEIVGHSYAEDIQLVLLSKEEERDEIRTCVKIFQDLVGVRPYGWLSSRMRHTEHTLELLVEEGFLWHGDAVNDDAPYPVPVNGKAILEIPYRNAISGLNDTGMYRRGMTARDILGAFKDEFDILYEESLTQPKMLTLAMHCQMAFPATGKVYEEAIRYAKSFPGVWFARRIDIVRWLLDHYIQPRTKAG